MFRGLGRDEGERSRVVYIIDDDASFRVAMKRRLQLAGFDVRAYAAAEQFLERGDDGQSPNCLLLDVEMPGMSGLELQNRLRALGSTIPIVFVSGCADDRVSTMAVEAGAHDFLTKPINSAQLLRSINAAMARQEIVFPHVSVSPRFTDELLARANDLIVEARLLRSKIDTC
jgi:FixJ family two-component response regulator